MGGCPKPGPADHCQPEEAKRRPHCGSSAGKMCLVLSQRVAPPPRCRDSARAAASIATTLPTNSRGYREQALAQPVGRGGEQRAHHHPPGEQPAVDGEQGDKHRIEPRLDRCAKRLGQPDLRPQKRGGVSGEQQQSGERTTAIAKPHPAFAKAAAPPEAIPAGKRDSAEPSRLLADGVAERRGKVTPGGDHAALAGLGWNAHEHGLEAERTDLEPDFVILGHAAGGERMAVLCRGEVRERAPGNRAADAGQRNRGADRFANHQLLDVGLGEFVAIMPADPARIGVGKGQHGKLDHGRAVDQPVEDPELERVDDVLGVVKDDRLGRAAGRGLVGDEGVVEMIEAIGLGRRAVGFDLDDFDARVADAGDGGERGRVVAVMADEDSVIGIIHPIDRRPEHRGDHRRLVPGGNEQGEEARLRALRQLAGEGARVARVNGHRAPDGAREVDQVDRKVVDREQQEADAREQGQLRRNPAEKFGDRHRRESLAARSCRDDGMGSVGS